MPSILVVDDEPGVRSSISGVLQDEGFDVDTASSGEECLEKANGAAFDVIVLDIWLPGLDGLTTLQRLRERQIDAQVVIISGHGNIESAVRAIKMGAFDFVEKPLSLEKTVLVVRNALRQRTLEVENRALREIGRAHVFQSRLHLVCRLLLEKKNAVAATGLLAVADTLFVQRAADDLVTDARQVLHTAAAHAHHRVLLPVVADSRSVGGHLDAR